MDRRQFLASMAGALAGSIVSRLVRGAESAGPAKSGLGIQQFSCSNRISAEHDGKVPRWLDDPIRFLKYCHALGAGGMQYGLQDLDEASADGLRAYAEEHNLVIEGSTGQTPATCLPRDRSDVDRFEGLVRMTRRTGARVMRLPVGQRRYEQFDTLEQFKAFAAQTLRSLQLAEKVAARHGMRLAIENHKDWRIDQMLGMLEKLDTEWVGVCIDTGNSMALLEGSMDVVKAYAPWACSVHLKDMAVAEYPDGFLLADVPLGEGLLDLATIVRTIRKAKPETRFFLEMSTRDALKVPCLTDRYWATCGDVPGADLARVLRYVRTHARAGESLPRVSPLPLEDLLELEEENIKKSLAYAATALNL